MSRSAFQFQPLKDKFQCIAFLEGSYLPSADNLRKGILVLADGNILPAYLDKQAIALRAIGKWKEGEIRCFNCYPRTSRERPYYYVHLNRPSPHCLPATAHVSGVVRHVEEDSYLVLVYRNEKPPNGQENSPHWKGFPVRVYHSKVDPGWQNHFCYFECRFEQGRHSCRRTALTIMHRNGVPLRVIQEISGHRSLEQLQRYLEVDQDQMRGAVAMLSIIAPVPTELIQEETWQAALYQKSPGKIGK